MVYLGTGRAVYMSAEVVLGRYYVALTGVEATDVDGYLPCRE